MSFIHNDIATKYSVDNAIAEGGGGGSDSGYDAVIEAYHDDASTPFYNGWEITIKSGSYAAIAAKLDEGTEAPSVLVKVKALNANMYGCIPATIHYYVPDAEPPYFLMTAVLMGRSSVWSEIVSANPTAAILTLKWSSPNIIETY